MSWSASQINAAEKFLVEKAQIQMSKSLSLKDTFDENHRVSAYFNSTIDAMVISIERTVHRTKEHNRKETSIIKEVYNENIGEIPLRLRDHLLILIGLRCFARMVVQTYNTHIHIERMAYITEKYCPHLNDSDRDKHYHFLSPTRPDNDSGN